MKTLKVWCCTEAGLREKLSQLCNIEVVALHHGPWWWICRHGAEIRFVTKKKLSYIIGPIYEQYFSKNKEIQMLIMTDSQKVSLAISPKTKAGNAAILDGIPVWTLGCVDHFNIAASEDGLSAVISSTGKLGVCQVNVTVDVDMGEGVEAITGTLDIEVKAGKAVDLGMDVGAPVEIG